MNIVIIHGHIAAGKTRRGKQLLRHYGCRRIVNEWDGKHPLKDGDLALTNMQPPFNIPGARPVDVVTAKKAVTNA